MHAQPWQISGAVYVQVRDTKDYTLNYAFTEAGPRLNIKTILSTYGDFHVKDKTAVRTSYL